MKLVAISLPTVVTLNNCSLLLLYKSKVRLQAVMLSSIVTLQWHTSIGVEIHLQLVGLLLEMFSGSVVEKLVNFTTQVVVLLEWPKMLNYKKKVLVWK